MILLPEYQPLLPVIRRSLQKEEILHAKIIGENMEASTNEILTSITNNVGSTGWVYFSFKAGLKADKRHNETWSKYLKT
jgi:hypothetical protein